MNLSFNRCDIFVAGGATSLRCCASLKDKHGICMVKHIGHRDKFSIQNLKMLH